MSRDARPPNERGDPSFTLGATGAFPAGKLHPTDEGELRLAVGHASGNVVIQFGKPVRWLGLPKAEALQFADMIRQHAEALP